MDATYGHVFNIAGREERSIFVGGVPRDTTAEMLAMNLEPHYGAVEEIAIHLDDKTLYPRGTALATFANPLSAKKAIWSQTLALSHGHRAVCLFLII